MTRNRKLPIDISLCIPTYNRVALLKKNLDHLLTFTSLNFEVIIGDNASSDDTNEVIQEYSHKFSKFTYHRHKQNIGFSRNTDAILRMARGQYIYIVCDDDLVYENALILMKYLLDRNPSVVGVSGKYNGVLETIVGANQSYVNPKVSFLKHRDYLSLIKNILFTDGNPFMRREAFQRHCIYSDRSLCLVPLFFKLLALGDIAFIHQELFQHMHNPESLSTKISETWFIDYTNADLEIALSDIGSDLPPSAFEFLRIELITNIYIQSARKAITDKKFTLLWHFLQRLRFFGFMDKCLLKCEINFLVRVLVERITKLISDLGIKTIFFQNIPLIKSLKSKIQTTPSHINWKQFSSIDEITIDHSEACAYILQDYDSEIIYEKNINNIISVIDLIDSLRLSNHRIESIINDNELTFYCNDKSSTKLLDSYCPHYHHLNSPYA